MPNTRQEYLEFRQSHAIVIGINHYPGIDAHLKTAVNDASRIAQLLKNNQGFDNVLVMLEPKMTDLITLIKWLGNKEGTQPFPVDSLQKGEETESRYRIGWYEGKEWDWESKTPLPLTDLSSKEWSIDPERDSILFYYAGHGIKGDPDEGPAGYLVPSDAEGDIGSYKNLIPMDELNISLTELGCLHTLLILDCCFAGKFRFSHDTRFRLGKKAPHLYKERFLQYTKSRAWQVLVSSGPDQEANDSFSMLGTRSKNSPFAASFIEALQGDADIEPKGVITAVELYMSVRRKVKEKKSSKEQFPGLFPMKAHRAGEFIFISPNFNFSDLKERPLKNPYKGLLPYEPEEEEWFFGREEEAEEAIKRIEGLPFLIIAGDSAVGKSSFAKGKLFARLKKELDFELLTLRPGSKPWNGRSASAKVKMLDGKERTVKYFTGLEELCRSVSGTGGADLFEGFHGEDSKNRMILIDQYEEIFTEYNDQEELAQFEEGLQQLIRIAERKSLFQKDTGTLRIVITIRSDFEWQLEASAFGQFLLRRPRDIYFNMVRLLPMELDQLREVLIGPASLEVMEFEEGLVDQILKDLNYAPAALPLLSFTMKQLYEVTMKKGEKDGNGDTKRIFTEYLYADKKDGIGGVIGALRTSADELYLSFGKKEDGEIDENIETPLQETMKKIILRMIRPAQGLATRRRVYQRSGTANNFWSELDYPLDEDDKMVAVVLEELEKAQLIVLGKDLGNYQNYVELAHDALVNNWPRCQEWIKKFGQDRLVLLRQLWEAALENKRSSLPRASSVNAEPYQDRDFVAATDRSAVIKTSSLWDNSPKLMEVIFLLWDPDCQVSQTENKDILEFTANFLENELKGEQISNTKTFLTNWIKDHQILIGDSLEKLQELDFKDPAEVLKLILFEGRHWLNQLEVEFIWESWNKRRSRIANLIRERDEARASMYATSGILEKQSGDFELGMRLAMKAWEMAPVPKSQLIYESFINGCFSRRGLWSVLIADLDQHEHTVMSAAFSPEGTKVLTASADGTAKIWDVTGRELVNLDRHNDAVLSAIFSPDGTKILTASLDGTAKIWDVSGHELVNLDRHKDEVLSAVFSPDGTKILTASLDGTAKIWDVAGHELVSLDRHEDAVLSAVFSPDGTKILTASRDHTVKIWDVSGHELVNLDQKNIILAVFSPDATKVVIASNSFTVNLWDLKGNVLANFEHEHLVQSAVFSPDGTKIATASFDGNVRVWDLEGSVLVKLGPTDQEVNSVAFSPDGSMIVASSGKIAKVWDCEGKLLATMDQHENTVKSVVFSPDGTKIVTTSYDKTAKIWDLNAPVLANLDQHNGRVDLALFSPDGTKVATAAEYTPTRIWDIEGNILCNLDQHGDRVWSLAFSPDGTMIVTASADKTAKIWDLKGNLLANLAHHWRDVSWAAFSPDSTKIVTGSMDRTVKVWNIEGKVLADLDQHKDVVHSSVFSPDGTTIVTASADKTAKIWDLKGNLLANLNRHEGAVLSAIFSPDGTKVVTSSSDGTAKIWDLKGNILVDLDQHKGDVSSAMFSSDGRMVVTSSSDGTAKIWDLKGNVLANLDQHTSDISSAMFSPDATKLVTASSDGTAKIWNVNGHLLLNLDKHESYIRSAMFSPDGTKIVTASWDKTAKIWPLPVLIQQRIDELEAITFTKKEKVKFGME